jgi:serine/threonine protein kinase
VLFHDEHTIKLGGFSNAIKIAAGSDSDAQLLGSVQFQAPELLQGKRFNKAVDIWAFGCFVYFLYVINRDRDRDRDREIASWHSLCVDLSAIRHSKTRTICVWTWTFNKERSSFRRTFGPQYRHLVCRTTWSSSIDSWLIDWLIDWWITVKALISGTLKVNPGDRPTATQLQQHAWFSENGTAEIADFRSALLG